MMLRMETPAKIDRIFMKVAMQKFQDPIVIDVEHAVKDVLGISQIELHKSSAI